MIEDYFILLQTSMISVTPSSQLWKVKTFLRTFQSEANYWETKIILQSFNESRLKSSFRKFYGRYNDLVCDYNLSLAHMLNVFNFPIVNCPFLCSNIPLSPAYGVYISQLIRYAKACLRMRTFLRKGKLLTKNWCCRFIMNLVESHHFANSTVVIMTLFAITIYHWLIFWNICFHTLY
jgi:hypothetical protein